MNTNITQHAQSNLEELKKIKEISLPHHAVIRHEQKVVHQHNNIFGRQATNPFHTHPTNLFDKQASNPFNVQASNLFEKQTGDPFHGAIIIKFGKPSNNFIHHMHAGKPSNNQASISSHSDLEALDHSIERNQLNSRSGCSAAQSTNDSVHPHAEGSLDDTDTLFGEKQNKLFSETNLLFKATRDKSFGQSPDKLFGEENDKPPEKLNNLFGKRTANLFGKMTSNLFDRETINPFEKEMSSPQPRSLFGKLTNNLFGKLTCNLFGKRKSEQIMQAANSD